MTNYTDARQQALLVKNATEDGSNTASRVGGAMETIIEYTHDAVAGAQENLNSQIERETTTREADDAAIIARMRGDEEHHDNYDDPLLRKTFNGTEQDAVKGKKDATAWLNTLHTTDTTNKKPIGQIRIDIDGSSVWVLSNVVSYAADVWSQTLYNANVVYEDGVAIVHPGEDVYTRVSKPLAERESAGDVWYDWQKLAKNSDIASYVNGHFAPLENGKIPTSYIPGAAPEVEDYASTAAFPVSGSTAKIYIALDTNKQYRWSGTQYVEISASLALGETSATAFAGDRGKTLETKVGTLESTVSGQSSTITTLGQNVSTLQGNFADLQESVEGDIEDMEEAIEGTAAVVELTDYMTEGSKAGQALPIGAVYTYVGVPIDGVRVYLDNSSYIFSIAKTSNGHPFQFVVFTKRQDAEEFIYTNTYWWNTAPDWVKRSFGEAPATQTYDGQMSKEDKKALDDLITNVSTNYYTKPQVDTALGNRASTTALSNEVTRAQNAETALGNSVTALQTAVGGKVGTIEFVRYETYEELDGEVMPWAGVFAYGGIPVPYVVMMNDSGDWDLLLRVSVHLPPDVEVYYHHFVSNYGEPANGWLFDDIYSKEVAPAWMLRAFGEAEATTSYPGMMSAADKALSENIAAIPTNKYLQLGDIKIFLNNDKSVTWDIPVTSIVVNKSDINLTAGNSTTVSVDVLPATALDKSTTWTVGNNSIISISGTGNTRTISALSAGTTTILVTSNSDGTKMVSINVTVVSAAPNISEYSITKIGDNLQSSGQYTNVTWNNGVFTPSSNSLSISGKVSQDPVDVTFAGSFADKSDFLSEFTFEVTTVSATHCSFSSATPIARSVTGGMEFEIGKLVVADGYGSGQITLLVKVFYAGQQIGQITFIYNVGF